MTRPRTIGVFVALGLVVALAVAFFVSPFASSSPDGLQRVAIDSGFEGTATDHALAGAPLADYGVKGDDGGLSTGVAGVIGVGLTFVVGAGLFLVIRTVRRRRVAA
jgi:cobalt/nickel transport system permease protein